MRHKNIDYPKYSDMHNMFKDKGVEIAEKPYVVELKVVDLLLHMVDVNVAIARSKVTEEYVFNDRKPIKNKHVVDWEEE
jgi:hypothetical protein